MPTRLPASAFLLGRWAAAVLVPTSLVGPDRRLRTDAADDPVPGGVIESEVGAGAFPFHSRRMAKGQRTLLHIGRGGKPCLGRLRFEGTAVEGGEDAKRVKIVAPLGDFAVLDGDHGNLSVAIGVAGSDDSAPGRVFEHDSRR